jgi:hypothetical protein
MAQLTQIQQTRLANAYVQDATNRGLGDKQMIAELLSFIFATRPIQVNQLQNLVQRVRDGITQQQAAFDAQKAIELTGLNQVGTVLDDLLVTIPTIT